MNIDCVKYVYYFELQSIIIIIKLLLILCAECALSMRFYNKNNYFVKLIRGMSRV